MKIPRPGRQTDCLSYRMPEFSWSALHVAARCEDDEMSLTIRAEHVHYSRGFPDVCVTLMEVGAGERKLSLHSRADVSMSRLAREGFLVSCWLLAC